MMQAKLCSQVDIFSSSSKNFPNAPRNKSLKEHVQETCLTDIKFSGKVEMMELSPGWHFLNIFQNRKINTHDVNLSLSGFHFKRIILN